MAEPLEAAWSTRARRLSSQLLLGALGCGLVLLVSIAWGSGLLYLAVRIGLPAPVRLTVIDGIHVYVGVASVAFFAAKIWRVGLAQRVGGVPELLLWHRWVSWSMLALYTAVYATGVLVLAPWPRAARAGLGNAHLITSVWAAVPTTWHVWHYRRLLVPYRPWRPSRGLAGRFWVGVLIALLPVGFLVAAPRALAPLTQSGAGGSWKPVLPGVFLDRMEATPDGRFFVAGGQGLYVGQAGQNKWQRADLPADLVLGLTLPAGSIAAYVGTAHGLYASPRVDGHYQRLPFPSWEVHAIAVDPEDSRTLWASSRQGFWRSRDGGDHWTQEVIGLQAPGTAWAITYFGSTLFASDGFGVYRWSGSQWDLSSHQGSVVSLDPTADGRRLFASSMGQGLQVFDGRTWQNSDGGLTHSHGGVRAAHLTSVTDRAGGLAFAATMVDGVSISKDGGRSWASLSAGLPPGGAWRVQADGSTLLAATNRGIYQYRLPVTPTPEAGWWAVLFTTALCMGGAAVALAALPQWRGTYGAAT